MISENQLSALLGVCLLPQVIEKTKKFHNTDEQMAIKHFFSSGLFAKLQDIQTGLWHLSPDTITEIYEQEINNQDVEYPEEQS